MLVVHVVLNIQAEKADTFLEVVESFVQEARATAGCRVYAWYQSTEQDNTYILYEEWESEAQFRAYKESDLFGRTQQSLLPYAAAKPNSTYFLAEVTEKF
ncbi:MAG: putative quinol monooxygenase [Chloroflexota bacterium]